MLVVAGLADHTQAVLSSVPCHYPAAVLLFSFLLKNKLMMQFCSYVEKPYKTFNEMLVFGHW